MHLMGSEAFLVSNKLLALIGDKLVNFWNTFILSQPVTTLKEVIRKLIPPKGINHRRNIGGSKVLDCEDEKIPLEDLMGMMMEN